MQPEFKTLTFTLKAVGDDEGDGEFEAILSTNAVDREGESVQGKAFEPLPPTLPIHWQHDFVGGGLPIGKGVPFYDGDTLKVKGTFAPTEKAQEIRTLVNGGFINSMSAGFITTQRKGKSIIKGDLLEGSMTATPVNTSAMVLASKALDGMKAGARNSKGDQTKIQAAHDLMGQLGASCSTSKSFKAIVGSVEALQCRVCDALENVYDQWTSIRGVVPNAAGDGGTIVFDTMDMDSPDGMGDMATYSQTFTDDGAIVTLTGAATEVDIEEHVVPDADAAREEPTLMSYKPKAAAAAVPDGTAADAAADDEAMELQRQRVRAWQMTA